MIDWFQVIISLMIGFALGRGYGIYKKFMKFLDKENQNGDKK